VVARVWIEKPIRVLTNHVTTSNITFLLERWKQGDEGAQSQLIQHLYPALEKIARRQLNPYNGNLTLQTSDLINEAYLRLISREQQGHNRTHFLAIASMVMRSVLIDSLRRRESQKRGGDVNVSSLDTMTVEPASKSWTVSDWLQLDQLLDELETIDPINARVVEARYFGGLTVAETAEACGVSTATVTRVWRFCKAWLHDRMNP